MGNDNNKSNNLSDHEGEISNLQEAYAKDEAISNDEENLPNNDATDDMLTAENDENIEELSSDNEGNSFPK